MMRKTNAGPFLFGLLLGCLAGAGADKEITIYPREYWRLVKGEKIVGHGGRLTLVEDEEGEEIEVVEYRVPRTVQRRQSILLFSTVRDPKRRTRLLSRKYQAWQNGRMVERTFEEPDEKDRTIYRRGSEAFERKVDSLYQTALLNASLAKISYFAQQAARHKLIRPEELPAAARHIGSYVQASAFSRSLAEGELYTRVCLYNLSAIDGHRAQLKANKKELVLLKWRQAAAAAKIAKLNKELGGRARPKGDPKVRRRDILLLEDYDLRADIEYLETENHQLAAKVQQIVLEIAADLQDQGAGFIAKLRQRLEARLKGYRENRQKYPDAVAVIREGTAEVAAMMAGLAAREELEGEAQRLVQQYRNAFAERSAAAEVAAALARQQKAVTRIPQLGFGRYRITIMSKLEGIENCLGTPIVISAGGITRTFYSYHWPDAENFHELTWDLELREGPEHMLAYQRPRPQASLNAYCPDLAHYNRVRLKGWNFAADDSFARLARQAFDNAKKSARERVAAHLQTLYRHNGTFKISIQLEQAFRRQFRGMGAPDASIDGVLLDYIKITPVEEPKLVLRQVLVQKNWLKPGQSNKFMGWLHNRTGKPQTGELKVIWVSGLNREKLIATRQVTLTPKSFKRVVVPWTSPQNAAWFGHEVRMELTCDGVATKASDVFSIHPNCFAVFSLGGHVGYDIYRGPKDYQNNTETMGITMCDSVHFFPDNVLTPFMCGMNTGAIKHVIQARAEAQRNHQLGVSSVMYLSPLCTGQKAYYHYLRRPAWFPGRLAWTESMNDNYLLIQAEVKRLYEKGERIDTGALLEKFPLLHLEQPLNHAQKLLFDNIVEDLITYHYLVDWDGVRWDGGPISVFSHDFLGRVTKHPKTGRPVKALADRKQLAADLFRELKERIWKHHPQWVYGNNGDAFGYGGTLLNLESEAPDVKDYPNYRGFMKDNGSYMDEGWMSAYNFADTRNKAARYLGICFKQAMVMKQNGGYLQTFSPERDGAGHLNVDHIYYTLLPHLAGASYFGRMSASPWSVDGPVHFYIRFGEFLMDPRLRPYPKAEDRINVDAHNVWSHEAASFKKLDNKHVQVIVPIINKHPRARLYDSQSRYSELPEPISAAFEVTVEAPAGFGDVQPEIWELSCEPRTAAAKLPGQNNRGVIKFTVEGLNLFKMIVLDFKRAE